MAARSFECAPGVPVGEGQPLAVFSGPCVIESLDLCLAIAEEMQGICARVGVGYVFKASFDKANRTSVSSFRGPGLEQGLKILQAVKDRLGCPVVTDLHMPEQAVPVAEVADILQIPAFLSRQTDLLLAAGETGRTVNIKKGQFLAPGDMAAAVAKVRTTGNQKIMVTERGTTFGYHNLVVDMRGLVEMASLGVPVVFDGTHSVQLPGGGGTVSGGQREYICPLVRGAVAVGVDALFLEVHPTPEKALCDGANSLPLAEVESLLQKVRALHELV